MLQKHSYILLQNICVSGLPAINFCTVQTVQSATELYLQ